MAINVNKINQSNNFRTRLTAPDIKRDYSALNMGYVTQGTGDMGYLYPVHFHELIPGQKINLQQETAVQFMPFVSNLFHEINGELLNYFVPYRLLMENKYEDWENFITGGVDGQDNTVLPTIKVKDVHTNQQFNRTLWDYFGLPIIADQRYQNSDEEVLAFPFRAYNLIYNEHIRIPDFMPKVDLDSLELQKGNWQWDYFTRSRIYQQRGVTPTVPLSNDTDEALQIVHEIQTGNYSIAAGGIVNWTQTDDDTGILVDGKFNDGTAHILSNQSDFQISGDPNHRDYITRVSKNNFKPNEDVALRIMPHTIENLGNYGINLNDFLQALGIMRFQVNNAKIEARYIDHLKVRWGVFPEDSRLQRPEYLGSEQFNISTEIVTQTAPGTAGGTQLGHISGQAWGTGRSGTEYEAKEHGIIITLMIIRPKTVYEGGIEKYWSKKTKFDFPTPELMNLPDVPIYKRELKLSVDNEENKEIFGYQGIYEEYRTSSNRVVAHLRPSVNGNLVTYTLARYFNTAPELNADFIKCSPNKNRIMQFPNEPTFIFFVRNNTNTAIPLPIQSEPAELANV